MYDKGYVMVSPHDMAVINEDGTMSRGSIMLPPGKIPFVVIYWLYPLLSESPSNALAVSLISVWKNTCVICSSGYSVQVAFVFS